jgi:hypothetical protein
MILTYVFVLAAYLIFFRNVKGDITFSNAMQSGLLGILLWIFIRALTLVLLIRFVLSLFD